MQPGDTLRIVYNDANTPQLNARLVAANHQFMSVRPLDRLDIVIHMPFSAARVVDTGSR
jgi:hypothetical protein